MTSDAIARVKNVSHRYGATVALDGVSIDIPARIMVGVIGPDGVGKSTLLGLIAGVKTIQDGEVIVFDKTIADKATLRDIRIMCTGRLDPAFVLKALRDGADGVLVMGCHPGQCHYEEGNYKAMRRMALLKRTLAQLGIEPERVQLGWASAAEGVIFAERVAEMTEKIRELGPLHWRDNLADKRPAGLPEYEEVRAHD